MTHVSLAVRDPRKSAGFYQNLLGAKATYSGSDSIELQTPGARDAISLARAPRKAGKRGGIEHFGFRLRNPRDIDAAVDAAVKAGGKLKARGEFGPGKPYVYLLDPDGYEVEIWYD